MARKHLVRSFELSGTAARDVVDWLFVVARIGLHMASMPMRSPARLWRLVLAVGRGLMAGES